ncbi:MAG: AAA family ATPase, partial [Blastocatellia bacterium]
QGIANFLRPYIARGDVLSIAECTPEQLALIERSNPRLLDAFHQLKIEEPSVERGRSVLLNFALAQGSGNHVELEAIERIDQLHRRYATYSAYPGRPARFLNNLLQDRTEGKTLNAEDVIAAFSRETGLPRALLDEREYLDLEAARAWFASRVIGQPDAVGLIVDLLAMVKAGLTRPHRPIASLLFIGPTGVGKTEMAKSLAEFLFQDRSRMTRFDMSEYSDPAAVNRLIGGVFSQEGLLTAKAREQPFAVILLDEFEKAHPSFFDLLLQILGEGRLTDSMGRVADFSNAVVIMTSNLGAESFQRGLTGFGQAEVTRQAAGKHFTNAVRGALRPELFNRIDRIAPFAPLDEASALRIAEREIERVKTRDGVLYRGVTINVRDGVARHFAHRGYDPRYGARPLKRVIERELLVPLSEILNQRKDGEPVQVNLWMENDRLKLDVQETSGDESGKQPSLSLALGELTRRVSSLRREAQALERSAAARNLQNEIYALRGIEKRLARGKWKNPEELTRVAELPKLQRADQAIRDFVERITRLEHETALALYGNKTESPVNTGEIRSRLSTASADWKELLLRIYTLRLKEPDKITLAVFGEDHKRMFELARIYYLLAVRQIGPDVKVEVRQLISKPPAQTKKKKGARDDGLPVEQTKIEKPDRFFAAPRENVIGIALGVNFPLAFPKLESERGLHTFTQDRKPARCLVDTSRASVEEYRPPGNITRHDTIGRQEKRRNYNVDQSLIDDLLLDRREQWSGQLTVDFVEWLIEDGLMAKVKRLIEN